MSLLPDSGIGYMLIHYPNAGLNLSTANCAAGQASAGNCVRNGATVQVFLPGQTEAAAYTFTVNNTDTPSSNPSTPFGVQVFQGADQPTFANLGRTFFENLTYLYDPINGFVGYQLAGTNGTSATVIPMLALQGGLTLPNGFLPSFMTFLMGGLTLQQTGSGTLSGPIIGPGSLTLQSGNVTLGAANTYGGGTTVNGGTLTIGSTGSITGLLTINPGGNFVNNGTVNSPGQWQVNQGTFTNSGSFVGSLANTGTATNNGTLSGSVINGNSGMFTNNGTVTGSVANMGIWTGGGTVGGDMVNSGVLSGIGTIQGSTTNRGVIAPGNSIGTMTVAGNFTQTASGTYTTEVAGAGASDRINVSGTATLGGQVVVSALPGMTFAPSTTYTIVNAAGGLSGTFASVNELYPFLLSTLSYDANNAYLNLAIGGFAGAAATPTQAAVGNVLDANVNNATGDFATVLGAMAFNTFSNTQAQATLQAISGNNYAGFSSSMVQGAQLFMNNFANQTGGGGSPVSNRVALAEACDVACDSTTPPKWGAWGGALGGLGTIGANQSVGSVTYNAGGFAAGLDRSITDSFRMGVTAGYTTGTQWVSGFDGMGRTNTFQVGLYGGFAQDKVYADALIGYAYSWNQMWRNIPVPGLPMRTAHGPHRRQPMVRPDRDRLSLRSRHQRQRLHHAVRKIAGLHRQPERLHRDRRAVAEPQCGAAADQLAALGDRRADRRLDGSRLAREACPCSCGWAGAMSTPTRHGRYRRPWPVHRRCRSRPSAWRRSVTAWCSASRPTRRSPRRRRSISATRATSPARTARMPSLPACA